MMAATPRSLAMLMIASLPQLRIHQTRIGMTRNIVHSDGWQGLSLSRRLLSPLRVGDKVVKWHISFHEIIRESQDDLDIGDTRKACSPIQVTLGVSPSEQNRFIRLHNMGRSRICLCIYGNCSDLQRSKTESAAIREHYF